MISRLDRLQGRNIYENTALAKLNEVIDAVNELQEMRKSCDDQICILAEQIAKLQHDNSEKANCQENVQDKFAEQRKWIGKLCKFWDDDPDDYNFDILKELTLDGGYVEENGFAYDHCKPVKPDDDIVYKGE